MRRHTPSTLLNLFLEPARDPETIDKDVVVLGGERWTYGELDIISSGLAVELKERHGLCPTVVVVSENHPFIIAYFLAIWKLGGTLAPLDAHAPTSLLKEMILNIHPTYFLYASNDVRMQELGGELPYSVETYSPKDATLTSLLCTYIHLTSPDLAYPPPLPTSMALYLHTSSATSVSNIKCVRLPHLSMVSGTLGNIRSWTRAFPELGLESSEWRPTFCGWSPFSHLVGIQKELCGAWATRGSYVFGPAPSDYPVIPVTNPEPEPHDTARVAIAVIKELAQNIPASLLITLLNHSIDIFACVPWALDGFKAILDLLSDTEVHRKTEEAIRSALQRLKYIGCAGAASSQECLQWAEELGLNLSLDFGMTELAGPIFHRRAQGFTGWSPEDCLIPDAVVRLVGVPQSPIDSDATQGELVVTSKLVGKGYLNRPSPSFVEGEDGTSMLYTGDIFEMTTEGYFLWKGRKDDYIQMTSGESVDPRPLEATLNASPCISRSCVVGNNFLSGDSSFVCAIVQPSPRSTAGEIARALGVVNRSLPPPLRIAWSRVLILDEGEEIPLSKKGAVFRKKMEELFGERVRRLGKAAGASGEAKKPSPLLSPQKVKVWKRDGILITLREIIPQRLGLMQEEFDSMPEAPFAELGMDSEMAVSIVTEINKRFTLSPELPVNACHTFIDFKQLSDHVISLLIPSDPMPTPSTTATPLPPKSPIPASKEEIDVVIVGQAVKLPGNVNDPSSFWEALFEEGSEDRIITPIPTTRWDHSSFYRSPSSSSPSQICDITFAKAGSIPIASFDNHFFGITSPEAYFITPNIRLVLELGFEAVESANIPLKDLKGSAMGVFVGIEQDAGYCHLMFMDKGYDCFTRYLGLGTASNTASGRLSYLLDLHGPSMVVDTACSSGLVALDHAVKYIQSGDGESAMVISANTHVMPGAFGFLSAANMSSMNSRCATFTSEADGYVPSEGAVAFVLKSRQAAVRDGDKILGVVRSSLVQHGGRSQGLSAPNVHGQVSLQKALLKKAGLAPGDIDFIETHGSGTPLGDLIEIQAINEVFKGSHTPENPLVLGATKSCFGHTEMAAGLVGLMRALASLEHGLAPPLKHLREDNMNPGIDTRIVPLHIPHKPVSLPKKNGGYRGLVLSNGFSGTLAATIIESPPPANTTTPSPTPNTESDESPSLFVVSAKTPEALQQYLKDYLHFCRSSDPILFQSICYSTCLGREHYPYRFACCARNIDELINKLEDQIMFFHTQPKPRSDARSILFAFPGQGSHYQGMAAALAERFEGFRQILLSTSTLASSVARFPVYSFLTDPSTESGLSINDGRVSQVCIFVFQYAMYKWLEKLGISPTAVLGHSLGEFAAATVAGGLTLGSALQLVVERASLLHSRSTPGAMAIVEATSERVTQIMRQHGLVGKMTIAVYSGPQSHVVSGEAIAVDGFLVEAKALGLRAARLNVDQGFHSDCISDALPDLQKWMENNRFLFTRLQLPFFSTVYGNKMESGARLGPHYWVEHARSPVQLFNAVESISADTSVTVILDMGPQPFIATAVQSLDGLIQGKRILSTATKRTGNQVSAFVACLASLFESGARLNFTVLLGKKNPSCMTSLPTYPFQRQYHYPSPIPSRSVNGQLTSSNGSIQAKVISPVANNFPVDQSLYDLLADHRIEGRRVAPGAALADFFARASSTKGLTIIRFLAPLVIESPATKTLVEIDDKGHFVIYSDATRAVKICAGINTPANNSSTPFRYPDSPVLAIFTHQRVYEQFHGQSVHFGPSFRNIQEVRIWADHADGLITVESSGNPALDRTRKLDSCLHMFGAIVSHETPQTQGREGSFLPSSLEGFQLHTQGILSTFICRYRLPLHTSRNSQVMSVAFELVSLAGELLASCDKYTVTWVPFSTNVRETKPNKLSSPVETLWLSYNWSEKQLDTPIRKQNRPYPLLVLVSIHQEPPVLQSLSLLADRIEVINLLSSGALLSTAGFFESGPVIIVIDVTMCTFSPDSPEFLGSCRQALGMMKVLVGSKIQITSTVLLSTMPSAPRQESLDFSAPSVQSIMLGMLRVLRRELGLNLSIWALDLPDLVGHRVDIAHILQKEIAAREEGGVSERVVAYRKGQGADGLARFVSRIERLSGTPSTREGRKFSGVAVVIGMGSIGMALAPALLASGCSKVVFLGRRSVAEVNELQGSVYRQVNVLDRNALRSTLVEVQVRVGPIEAIIHTAAVISDATIQNIAFESFQEVLNPKVQGAWNLHILSDELKLPLKAFVLLSTISVAFGNPGRVAYVAANSFLDDLASYRRQRGLHGTSLQLGPWESNLVKGMDFSTTIASPLHNSTGIPMIMQAMDYPYPIQLIARLDLLRLASTSVYSTDPLFEALLPQQEKTLRLERPKVARKNVPNIFINTVRSVLELRPSEHLELTSGLTHCGVDSIAFAEIRKEVQRQLDIESPTTYLQESFTIEDIIQDLVRRLESTTT